MQHNKRKVKDNSGIPPKIPKISVSEDKKEGVVKLTKQLTEKGSDKTGGGKNIGKDGQKILSGNKAPSKIKILTKNDKPNVALNKQDDKISKNAENKTESKFAKKRPHPTKYTKITSKEKSRKLSGVKFNGSNNDKSPQRATNKIKSNTSVKKMSLEPKNDDSDRLNSESPGEKAKLVFDKQGKKRKWKERNDRTAKYHSQETESNKGNIFKTPNYNVNRHIKYDAEKRQNKTPLTDRQKHKRWKLRQKRALKNAQLKDTNLEEGLPTADVSETGLVKELKPKFEKFVLPKSHDDASLNWKKLQSVST